MFKAELIKQNWDQSLPRYWNDNSPFKTHFLNALSITLPECEKFFIETIRPFRQLLTDEEQILEVEEFCKQESHHRHIHNQYNDWLESQGLPVAQLQKSTDDLWNKVRAKHDIKNNLAITTCIEHLTVVYSKIFLGRRTHLKRMHPQFELVWRWHSIEEIEHRAVAMDIWYQHGGTLLERRITMLYVVSCYMWYVGKNTILFLHHDKQLWKWRTLTDFMSLMFNHNSGLITQSFLPWCEFMKKDFHPKNHNYDLYLKYSKI